MSDNITPLHPEEEQKRKKRKRIFSLVGSVVLVLLVLGVILFRQELNFDKLRRQFSYMGIKDQEGQGSFEFDAHSSNLYRGYFDGLAIASIAGLEIYDQTGEESVMVSATMAAPAIGVGQELVMAYDVGGTELCAAGTAAGVVLDRSTGAPILDADISKNDEICYASAEEGHKTVLTVLDREQKEIYRWLSSTRYMPLCAISDGARTLAAVTVGQSEGVFESSVQLFETDSEEPGPEVSLGNQLILDLDFLDGKRLCAIGESSTSFLNIDGEELGEYSYEGSYLKDFTVDGRGFVLLALNMYQAGSRYSIATVGLDGSELGRAYLGEEILSVSAAGGYAAVLTAGGLNIYTSDLRLYAETENTIGASDVIMREDGSALLIGSGTTRLFLP